MTCVTTNFQRVQWGLVQTNTAGSISFRLDRDLVLPHTLSNIKTGFTIMITALDYYDALSDDAFNSTTVLTTTIGEIQRTDTRRVHCGDGEDISQSVNLFALINLTGDSDSIILLFYYDASLKRAGLLCVLTVQLFLLQLFSALSLRRLRFRRCFWTGLPPSLPSMMWSVIVCQRPLTLPPVVAR